MYGIRQFASWKPLRFYMVGDETFSKVCLKTGLLCTLGSSAAGGFVLLYMWVEAPSSIELTVPLMIVTSVSFLIFGFGLGCSRSFPVRHVLKLTSWKTTSPSATRKLRGAALIATAARTGRWPCSQEKVVVLCVTDAQEMSRWLRCVQLLE